MLNFSPWDRPNMAPRPAATGPQQQLLPVEMLFLAIKLAKIGHEHLPNAQHKPRKAQHGPDMANKSPQMNHETPYPLFMLNFGPWDRPNMAPRPAPTGPQQQLLAVEVLFWLQSCLEQRRSIWNSGFLVCVGKWGENPKPFPKHRFLLSLALDCVGFGFLYYFAFPRGSMPCGHYQLWLYSDGLGCWGPFLSL